METNEQKIIPHLWYDREAKRAAEFYTSILPDSKITNITTLNNTPSGSTDSVSFELMGQPFMAISAGPLFKFNPSLSFLVACETKEQVDSLWDALAEGGVPLMALGEYPFSERYGWIQDMYGLSWQLMYTYSEFIKQKITPTLMFVGKLAGKTEEAINFYASVFHNSKIGDILRYGKGEEPDQEGTVKHAAFTLEGQHFAAMDSALEHGFAFNEAISLIVSCDSQEEIDYYWNKLTAVPEAEQCGWLKDRYGLSWQVVPSRMNEIMQSGDRESIARVTEAFLKMKKFDIAALEKAYRSE
jgi:predicted 3-demethylubiquinone-9 3-methyltransferase (glyoxalase superfamily)